MNNKELFYEFLKNKGFTEKGANETIQRIEERRADEIDIYQLKDFKKEGFCIDIIKK